MWELLHGPFVLVTGQVTDNDPFRRETEGLSRDYLVEAEVPEGVYSPQFKHSAILAGCRERSSIWKSWVLVSKPFRPHSQ